MKQIVVTEEMIDPYPRDIMAEIQARMVEAYIEKEKAELAAVTSPEFAEFFWTFTALDTYAFLGLYRD